MMGLILACWYAGTASCIFAAMRMWRNGMLHRFPVLFGLLSVVSGQALILMIVLQRQPARYAEIYTLTAWCVMLFEGLAPIEAFWKLTEHYPNFRRPGAILLSLLAVLGASIVWAAGYGVLPAGWVGGWHFEIFVRRAVSAILFTVLLGTRIFLPKTSIIQIQQSARRVSSILTLRMAVSLTLAIFTVATALKYPAIVSFITVINTLLLGSLCAIYVTRESDARALAPGAAPGSWVNGAAIRLSLEGLERLARISGRQS